MCNPERSIRGYAWKDQHVSAKREAIEKCLHRAVQPGLAEAKTESWEREAKTGRLKHHDTELFGELGNEFVVQLNNDGRINTEDEGRETLTRDPKADDSAVDVDEICAVHCSAAHTGCNSTTPHREEN
jgi:hypothetical protein